MSRLSATNQYALTGKGARAEWMARVADYVELTKPRIVALELVTVIVAAQLAAPWGIDKWVLLNAVVGAALVAASAGAINQWWEQGTDARMVRTARRPLPTGRLNSHQVIVFGGVTLIVGICQLIGWVNVATATIAAATWLIYVFVYTPLKTRSPINTAVGAISGALPILIGWTATGAAIDMRALALVSVMFLWQFPHFMAIAWLYRAEYAGAGHQMLTVVDPSGLRAGAQALIGALALVPVSLVLALSQCREPVIYCVWALLLGAGQAAAALRFLMYRDNRSARWLLRASLIYLTCWMGLLLIVAV